MKEPQLNATGNLTLNTGKTIASAMVTGSYDLESKLTDQFFSPQIDLKQKYGPIPIIIMSVIEH